MRRAWPAHPFLAHFVDEARRVAGAHFAAGLAALAVADAEAALGAGDADVHQAAFFLDLVFVDRALVGQQAFFDADEEDVLELQALGGVQGGQLNLVEFGVVLVEHGDQADGLDHVHQRLAVLLALSAQPAGEIAHVAPLGFGFPRLAAFVQPGFVVDGLEHVVDDLPGGLARGAVGHAVDEVAELAHGVELARIHVLGAAPSSKAAANRLSLRLEA
jgi:hypothetical protein